LAIQLQSSQRGQSGMVGKRQDGKDHQCDADYRQRDDTDSEEALVIHFTTIVLIGPAAVTSIS
jgi:hypothetical protein